MIYSDLMSMMVIEDSEVQTETWNIEKTEKNLHYVLYQLINIILSHIMIYYYNHEFNAITYFGIPF